MTGSIGRCSQHEQIHLTGLKHIHMFIVILKASNARNSLKCSIYALPIRMVRYRGHRPQLCSGALKSISVPVLPYFFRVLFARAVSC